jgi:ATP-dependent Clp protease adaptor protein ClpS
MKTDLGYWPDEDGDVLVEDVTDVKEVAAKQIVLYNDDHNTFQTVIDCLVKYCKHHPHQAEQCALIVHHNGKCAVKEGDMDTLIPICGALLENGLTAKIE